MPRSTLYSYVDGSDLDEVANEIESSLEALVASATWKLERPTIVNHKHERDDSYGPEDLTDWDLGLTLNFPEAGPDAAWFRDVEQVARLVARVAVRTGREFVIGIADNATGSTQDLVYVENGEPDLTSLRAIIGVDTR